MRKYSHHWEFPFLRIVSHSQESHLWEFCLIRKNLITETTFPFLGISVLRNHSFPILRLPSHSWESHFWESRLNRKNLICGNVFPFLRIPIREKIFPFVRISFLRLKWTKRSTFASPFPILETFVSFTRISSSRLFSHFWDSITHSQFWDWHSQFWDNVSFLGTLPILETCVSFLRLASDSHFWDFVPILKNLKNETVVSFPRIGNSFPFVRISFLGIYSHFWDCLNFGNFFSFLGMCDFVYQALPASPRLTRCHLIQLNFSSPLIPIAQPASSLLL